ncbi:MAG: hypothetical protein QOH96_109 [Blastocatellia bacterium]|nr:hypothetical protein [Blastocatellia bacterium]
MRVVILSGCGQAYVARKNSNTGLPQVRPAEKNLQEMAVDSSSDEVASMLRVLVNPKKFHGKRVQLIGFVHFEFEGDAIYLSREDSQYALDQNGIWLSIPKESRDKYQEINDSYAFVDGTFNAEHRGHMGVFSGSIENITMIKRWAKVKK